MVFTQLYERGLVYKKMATVNWDPVTRPFWPMSR